MRTKLLQHLRTLSRGIAAWLMLSAASADDVVVMLSGKAVRCRVLRYAQGMFVCEIQRGSVHKVARNTVTQIFYDVPDGEEPPNGSIVDDPGTPESMTHMNPAKAVANNGKVMFNKRATEGKDAGLVIRGHVCKEFIYAPAPYLVKFKVPFRAKKFTAIAGSIYSSDQSTKFAVVVDEQRLFKSFALASYPYKLIDIAVELPLDASYITLVVEGNAPAYWAYPTFWIEN